MTLFVTTNSPMYVVGIAWLGGLTVRVNVVVPPGAMVVEVGDTETHGSVAVSIVVNVSVTGTGGT
ncbi:MAG: hypothetical protein QW680_13465 [Pyrobaculum sp.]